MWMLSFYFFIFIQARTLDHGVVLPLFMVGLPNSTDPVWKLPHKWAPKFVSMVILNLM